jgi:hypothetical protein
MAAHLKRVADKAALPDDLNEQPKKNIKSENPQDQKIKEVASKKIEHEEEEKKVDLSRVKFSFTLTEKELSALPLDALKKKYPQTTKIDAPNVPFDVKMVESLSDFESLSSLSICVKDQNAALALGKILTLKNLEFSCQDQAHPIIIPPMKGVEALSIKAKLDDRSIDSLQASPKISSLSLNTGKYGNNQNNFGPRGVEILLYGLPKLEDLSINIAGKPPAIDFLKSVSFKASALRQLSLETEKFQIAPFAPWAPCFLRLPNLSTITFKSQAKESDEKPLTAQMLLFSLIAKFPVLRKLEAVIFENSRSEKSDGTINCAVSQIALDDLITVLLPEVKKYLGKLYTFPRLVIKQTAPDWALDFYDLFFELGMNQNEADEFLDNVIKNYNGFFQNVNVCPIS